LPPLLRFRCPAGVFHPATLLGFEGFSGFPRAACRDRSSLPPYPPAVARSSRCSFPREGGPCHQLPPGGRGVFHTFAAFPPSGSFASRVSPRASYRPNLGPAPGFSAFRAILCHTSGYSTLGRPGPLLPFALLRPLPPPAQPGPSALVPSWGLLAGSLPGFPGLFPAPPLQGFARRGKPRSPVSRPTCCQAHPSPGVSVAGPRASSGFLAWAPSPFDWDGVPWATLSSA
jgi:hypothetical protein